MSWNKSIIIPVVSAVSIFSGYMLYNYAFSSNKYNAQETAPREMPNNSQIEAKFEEENPIPVKKEVDIEEKLIKEIDIVIDTSKKSSPNNLEKKVDKLEGDFKKIQQDLQDLNTKKSKIIL